LSCGGCGWMRQEGSVHNVEVTTQDEQKKKRNRT